VDGRVEGIDVVDGAGGTACKPEMAGATLGSVASALVTVVVAVDSDEVVSDGTVDVAADAAAVSMPLVGDACVVELEALPHEASATVMPSASPKADRRTGGHLRSYSSASGLPDPLCDSLARQPSHRMSHPLRYLVTRARLPSGAERACL